MHLLYSPAASFANERDAQSHQAAAEDTRARRGCHIDRVLACKRRQQPHADWFDAANRRAPRDRKKNPSPGFRVATASANLPTRPAPLRLLLHDSLRLLLKKSLWPACHKAL